jgi:ABC-2 type transport system permease protein
MLWYKAWLETRSRFLICLIGITALCSFAVYHGDRQALSYTGLDYYRYVLLNVHAMLCESWVLAVTLLMMGGLVREKAIGSSSFTLALPVSRRRLMAVRIGMGLLQAFALAIVPSGAMFLIGSVFGKTRSVTQAAFCLALLLGGGLLFLALALLISSLVEGEYTAPVVSFGILIAIATLFGDRSLRIYSPLAFITGFEYRDRHTWLLVGPIPWLHIAAYLLLAAALIIASVKVIERGQY